MVEAGKVTLPEISGVVHVAHVVQIMRKDHAVDALLSQQVPHSGLERRLDEHMDPPQEIPNIQSAEEQEEGGQHQQQHL